MYLKIYHVTYLYQIAAFHLKSLFPRECCPQPHINYGIYTVHHEQKKYTSCKNTQILYCVDQAGCVMEEKTLSRWQETHETKAIFHIDTRNGTFNQKKQFSFYV